MSTTHIVELGGAVILLALVFCVVRLMQALVRLRVSVANANSRNEYRLNETQARVGILERRMETNPVILPLSITDRALLNRLGVVRPEDITADHLNGLLAAALANPTAAPPTSYDRIMSDEDPLP